MLWVGLGGCLGWVWLSVFVVLVWSLVGVFQCRVECYSLGVVQVCLFCGAFVGGSGAGICMSLVAGSSLCVWD